MYGKDAAKMPECFHVIYALRRLLEFRRTSSAAAEALRLRKQA